MGKKEINWEKLRTKYFHECVALTMTPGHYESHVRLIPEELFEWFKKNIEYDGESIRLLSDLAQLQNGARLASATELYEKTMEEVWKFLHENEK